PELLLVASTVKARPAPHLLAYGHAERPLDKARYHDTIEIPVADEPQMNHCAVFATNPGSPWLYQTSPSMNSSKNGRTLLGSAGSAVRLPSSFRRNTSS